MGETRGTILHNLSSQDDSLLISCDEKGKRSQRSNVILSESDSLIHLLPKTMISLVEIRCIVKIPHSNQVHTTIFKQDWTTYNHY